MINYFILFFIPLLFLIQSCGHIQMIEPGGQEAHRYNASLISQIQAIKQMKNQGDFQRAYQKAAQIDDKMLSDQEKALKYNLLGTISFAQAHYQVAYKDFRQAEFNCTEDVSLLAQIKLNLMSTHYVLGEYQQALHSFEGMDFMMLSLEEKKKAAHLRYAVYEKMGKREEFIGALSFYFELYDSQEEISSHQLYTPLVREFDAAPEEEKWSFFYANQFKGKTIYPHLALREMKILEAKGASHLVNNYADYLKNYYPQYLQQGNSTSLSGSETAASENGAVSAVEVGVILPFQGSKAKFGRRGIMGIELAIEEIKQGKEGHGNRFFIHTKDDKGSGAVGAQQVKELINEHSVGVIVGGLFPEEALEEYLEARRQGRFFISLSPIPLASEDKDYLLFEVPPSVESQLEVLFSPEVLRILGKKVAYVSSGDKVGGLVFKEFWKKAKKNDVKVQAIEFYQRGQKDYRSLARGLLDLNYPKERQEEYDLMKEIYSAQYKSIKRLQILPPYQDFNWIYFPSFPDDALQIIPTLQYYDLYSMNYVGGPPWRSSSLTSLSSKTPLMFVDSDEVVRENFVNAFKVKYAQTAGIVEEQAYWAIKLANALLSYGNFSTRDDLIHLIKSRGEISMDGHEWKLEDNLWIKSLKIYRYSNGKITSLN